MHNSFTLHCITWQSGATMIREVRKAARELDLSKIEALTDESDACSYHALALSRSGKAIGCARITPDGEAERMVVLPYDNHEQIESALIMAAWLHENQSKRYA